MSLIKLVIYSTKTNKEPYSQWEDDLDTMTKAVIKSRLERIRLGNFGDAKILKEAGGIWELRIHYASGYRVYFGKDGPTIIVLLLGGDKGSQERDIAKAKRYWLDYKESL